MLGMFYNHLQLWGLNHMRTKKGPMPEFERPLCTISGTHVSLRCILLRPPKDHKPKMDVLSNQTRVLTSVTDIENPLINGVLGGVFQELVVD